MFRNMQGYKDDYSICWCLSLSGVCWAKKTVFFYTMPSNNNNSWEYGFQLIMDNVLLIKSIKSQKDTVRVKIDELYL